MRKVKQFLVSLLLLFSLQVNALSFDFDDSYTIKNPNRNDYRPEVKYLGKEVKSLEKYEGNWCGYSILKDGPKEYKDVHVNLSSYDLETMTAVDVSKLIEANIMCYEGDRAYWEGKLTDPAATSVDKQYHKEHIEVDEYNYISEKKKLEELLAIKNGKGVNSKHASAQGSSSNNNGNGASESGQSNQYNQYDKSPLADLSSAAGFNRLDPSKQVIIKRDRVKVGARKYKDASGCLELVTSDNTAPSYFLKNKCSYKISYTYCFENTDDDNHFSCEKGEYGGWFINPHKKSLIANYGKRNSEDMRINIAACEYPGVEAMGEYLGSGRGFKFNCY